MLSQFHHDINLEFMEILMWDTWCLGGDTDGCYFEFESKQSSLIISFSYQRNFYALQITSFAMHHLYVICRHERDISPIH